MKKSLLPTIFLEPPFFLKLSWLLWGSGLFIFVNCITGQQSIFWLLLLVVELLIVDAGLRYYQIASHFNQVFVYTAVFYLLWYLVGNWLIWSKISNLS